MLVVAGLLQLLFITIWGFFSSVRSGFVFAVFLSLMVVSQRPSEVSETIFSQCNNFIVLKLTNINDQNCIKNLLPDNNASLVDVLPTLAAGECLIVGDAVPLPAIVKIDMPNPAPNSSDVHVFDEWNKEWINVIFEDVVKRWRKE